MRANAARRANATGEAPGLNKSAPGVESWRRVGREQLALLAGCHPDEISRAAKRGMPVLEPGGPGVAGVYDSVTALQWFRAKRGGTAEAERARRDAATAALAEQTFATRSRALLPALEVERVWGSACGAIKAGLLAIPTAEAEKLVAIAGERGTAGVEARLEEIVRRVLTELAS